MKSLWVGLFLLASVALALVPAASAVYREAYPSEPAKRAALAACARSDPGFDRLFAADRAKCYARQLQSPAPPGAVPRSLDVVEIAVGERAAV